MSRSQGDLRLLQSLPLETKEPYSIEKIRAASDYAKSVGRELIVSDSGGLDSGVLVDLARRSGVPFRSIFVDTGLEYPEVRRMAIARGAELIRPKMTYREVIEKHGWPVISKEVAMKIDRLRRPGPNNYKRLYFHGLRLDGKFSKMSLLSKKWRYLLGADFKISDLCCNELKKKPLKAMQKNAVAVVGTMADESINRQSAWQRTGCNSFSGSSPMAKPLSIWTKQAALAYTRDRGLPYASVYGDIFESDIFGGLSCSGVERTGCVFCMFGIAAEVRKESMHRFDRLRLSHPKLHAYALDVLGVSSVLDFLGIKHLPSGGQVDA